MSRCVRKQATAQTWWEKVEGLGTVLDGTSPWALRACDWDWEPLYCLCFHCMVLSVGYLKHFRNLTRSCMEETSVVVVGTFIQLYFEYCKVCFVGVSCAFQTAKEETIIFKTEKITKQFCSTYSTVNTWVLWKPSSSLLLHWESRMKIAARCC